MLLAWSQLKKGDAKKVGVFAIYAVVALALFSWRTAAAVDAIVRIYPLMPGKDYYEHMWDQDDDNDDQDNNKMRSSSHGDMRQVLYYTRDIAYQKVIMQCQTAAAASGVCCKK